MHRATVSLSALSADSALQWLVLLLLSLLLLLVSLCILLSAVWVVSAPVQMFRSCVQHRVVLFDELLANYLRTWCSLLHCVVSQTVPATSVHKHTHTDKRSNLLVRNIGSGSSTSANVYGPLDTGMVILQLCRWMFSHRNFVADFIQLKFTFIFKKRKIAFWATLWGT